MSKTIAVGDRNYTLAPFKASKGTRVLNAVTRIGKKAKPVFEAWNAYDQEYRQKNQLVITRELAEVRRAQAPTDEMRDYWQRMLDGPLAERTHVEIPQTPTFEQKLIIFFPEYYEMAEEEVVRLVALVLIDNGDMKKARRTGNLEDKLQEIGDHVLDELDIEDMMQLVLDAVTLIRGQLEKARGTAGKIQEEFRLWQRDRQAEPAESDPREQTPQVGTVISTSEPSESSSTDSPPPTDGTPSESSSESPGATSVATSV